MTSFYGELSEAVDDKAYSGMKVRFLDNKMNFDLAIIEDGHKHEAINNASTKSIKCTSKEGMETQLKTILGAQKDVSIDLDYSKSNAIITYTYI